LKTFRYKFADDLEEQSDIRTESNGTDANWVHTVPILIQQVRCIFHNPAKKCLNHSDVLHQWNIQFVAKEQIPGRLQNVCISAEQHQVRKNENKTKQSKYSDLSCIINKSRANSNFKNQLKLRKKKAGPCCVGGRCGVTFLEKKLLWFTITIIELNAYLFGISNFCLDWTRYLLGNFQFK
jgi:hypothetical protein